LTVGPEEAFAINVRFELREPPARSLIEGEAPFQVRVFAEEITSGARVPLAAYAANLVKDRSEYEVEMPAAGVRSGVYRLVAVVALDTPVRTIGYHDQAILNVPCVESLAPTMGRESLVAD
jgi:hypothetical protein